MGAVLSAAAVHLMGQTTAKIVKNLSPYYHRARVRVIRRHYRGVNRWSRLAAVGVLDACVGRILRSNRPRGVLRHEE